MSSRSSVDRDDFALMDDEPAMKRKRTTEFARSVKLIASLFEANDLALVRGNLPRATCVMQRVRQDGFVTPLWESLGESETIVPLTNAVYMMGGPESKIQSYVRRAACNVVGIAAAVHGNVEFPDVPAYSGEYVFANGVLDLYGSTFTAFNDFGRFDNWQACLMLIGVGGSGKTTVTDAVTNAGYNPDVVVAADVQPLADRHTIINGERVEINIKYGGRRTLQWVAPFMLVANMPPTANSQLATELKDPAVQVQILLRCSKVYRELAVRYKQDGTMPNILAKYYPRRAEVGSKVQQDNDPLVHFVAEVLVHTPGRYVSMASLREHKTHFCKQHEYDPKLVQFRKEFQNIVSAKGMKVYTNMHEIAQSNRAKEGQFVPKSAFIDKCSINAFAVMEDDQGDNRAHVFTDNCGDEPQLASMRGQCSERLKESLSKRPRRTASEGHMTWFLRNHLLKGASEPCTHATRSSMGTAMKATVGSAIQILISDIDLIYAMLFAVNQVGRYPDRTYMTQMFTGSMLKAHLEIDHMEFSATVLDKAVVSDLIKKIGQAEKCEVYAFKSSQDGNRAHVFTDISMGELHLANLRDQCTMWLEELLLLAVSVIPHVDSQAYCRTIIGGC
ncbi:hypothetical protein T492DRAFT_843210 [Pavlovales sp. CCMP2436]|nr:hypothetical protein T492DRAFT_843210 [Pavlovales sp. CCMP2436]